MLAEALAVKDSLKHGSFTTWNAEAWWCFCRVRPTEAPRDPVPEGARGWPSTGDSAASLPSLLISAALGAGGGGCLAT